MGKREQKCRLGIRLGENLYKAVGRLSQARRVAMNQFIARAINGWLWAEARGITEVMRSSSGTESHQKGGGFELGHEKASECNRAESSNKDEFFVSPNSNLADAPPTQ